VKRDHALAELPLMSNNNGEEGTLVRSQVEGCLGIVVISAKNVHHSIGLREKLQARRQLDNSHIFRRSTPRPYNDVPRILKAPPSWSALSAFVVAHDVALSCSSLT
jgi:hypothetical protein